MEPIRVNESRDFDRMEPRDIKLEYLARGIHHARFSSGRREAASAGAGRSPESTRLTIKKKYKNNFFFSLKSTG